MTSLGSYVRTLFVTSLGTYVRTLFVTSLGTQLLLDIMFSLNERHLAQLGILNQAKNIPVVHNQNSKQISKGVHEL